MKLGVNEMLFWSMANQHKMDKQCKINKSFNIYLIYSNDASEEYMLTGK